jgi:uncharacterized membrane protein
MRGSSSPHVACMLCGRESVASSTVSAAALRPLLADYMRGRHADVWRDDGRVCRRCRNTERGAYLLEQLERERGELSAIEAEVSRRAAEHSAIAADIEAQFQRKLTVGQRLADGVARVGGSWPFVIGFGVVLLIWIVANTVFLRGGAFDPYPYILLNLALSCLAAIQAPIIMMSQNRSAARDRLEADEDYKVNLKAELEIASLHEKVDHLLHVQWERMVEIQQTQLELLTEMASHRR